MRIPPLVRTPLSVSILLLFGGLCLLLSIKSFYSFDKLIVCKGLVEGRKCLPSIPGKACKQYQLVQCYDHENCVASIDMNNMDSVICVDDSLIYHNLRQ